MSPDGVRRPAICVSARSRMPTRIKNPSTTPAATTAGINHRVTALCASGIARTTKIAAALEAMLHYENHHKL